MSSSIETVGFSHIGFAVASVTEFQDTWGRALGMTDWIVHEETAADGIQLHGRQTGPLAVEVAFARFGGIAFELIETKLGTTHHSEHLAKHSSGLHHIAFWVDNLGDELEKVEQLGLEVVMAPPTLPRPLASRPVSAVVSAGQDADVAVPQFFAFLDRAGQDHPHFALELLDARFAHDYRELNGNAPFYPGELAP